jgi:hypothetical protein
MLSFLRDQSQANLAKKASKADKPQEQKDDQPTEQEFLTVEDRKIKARRSTIILGVLFAIGLICLWMMVKRSSPQAATAADSDKEEIKIESAIARLTGAKSEMFSGMDEIVRKFYEFSNVMQIRVNELAKNPFILEMFMSDLKEASVEEVEKVDEVDAETIRHRQVRMKAERLKLLSIMQSERSKQQNQQYCCMIDNEILYEGDMIEDFKILQIGNDFVKLQWDDQGESGHERVQIVLKLPE